MVAFSGIRRKAHERLGIRHTRTYHLSRPQTLRSRGCFLLVQETQIDRFVLADSNQQRCAV